MSATYQLFVGDCTAILESLTQTVDLTFLDPPFNQGKEYPNHNDNLPDAVYWEWMETICREIYRLTSKGGAIYFMQREKNTEFVLRCLRNAGWTLQNLIIWKKLASAVPNINKFGKHYQIIAFATKGKKPRIFNRLRIDPPLPPNYRYERQQGMYVTDVWDDIRELTSGYYAGEEPLRNPDGSRFHKQQSPVQLLLRILLSSSMPGDWVLDPFAGTGTTLIVARQLARNAIGIEKSEENARCIRQRLESPRKADEVEVYFKEYRYTENLDQIWGKYLELYSEDSQTFQLSLIPTDH
ncbi:MAG: DNA-methyltransferase [Anaerolineales bacterium]